MDDQTFGWTVQMQVRALRAGLWVTEVPVDYRRRIGKSKISGTLSGVVRAGTKIISTIFRERWRPTPLPGIAPNAEHVIVFTRYPQPGRTKTRMIPTLGPEGAAELQHRMTLHTLAEADRLQLGRCVSVEVRVAGGDGASMAILCGAERLYVPQLGEDLDERMQQAFTVAFGLGALAIWLASLIAKKK